MSAVRAKKFLGQHFLTDKNLAAKIVDSLTGQGYAQVLEVGPGMGILTDFLLSREEFELYLIDIDTESIEYLHRKYPRLGDRIISGDFLQMDFGIFQGQIGIIGNFPYNISSQILFKILNHKEQVPETVGMFQKEVAERIAAKPRTKEYGILSVLIQAYYTIEYLFTVNPGVFNPPPKVKSAVIRLSRAATMLDCNEKLFFEVVKAAFNQRRKMLRNALSNFINPSIREEPVFDLRAEVLSVPDFIRLTNLIENARKS